MYNLTILSFVPNQSERRLNLNARPRRELRANEVIRVIFNLFNSCPCTCCVCADWAESSAAKAQCEFIHVLFQWRTFHSARALCSHSKHQHSLYTYEYVRVRGTTLSWWMHGECCANSRSCEPKKSNRAGSAARSECVCVCVSELVLVDEKSLHLWFVIYVAGTTRRMCSPAAGIFNQIANCDKPCGCCSTLLPFLWFHTGSARAVKLKSCTLLYQLWKKRQSLMARIAIQTFSKMLQLRLYLRMTRE
jgi:hypothetical protein